jgi:hypothetical protein
MRAVRHLTQPLPGRQVRRLAVDNQPFLRQPAGERHMESVPQIADESLDLALRWLRQTFADFIDREPSGCTVRWLFPPRDGALTIGQWIKNTWKSFGIMMPV